MRKLAAIAVLVLAAACSPSPTASDDGGVFGGSGNRNGITPRYDGGMGGSGNRGDSATDSGNLQTNSAAGINSPAADSTALVGGGMGGSGN